jgi:hypothetical protein
MSSSDLGRVPPSEARLSPRELRGLLLRDPFTVAVGLCAAGFGVGLFLVFASNSAVSEWWAAPFLGVLLSAPIIWLIMFDTTRLRMVSVALARVVEGDVWQVVIAQDTARVLREAGMSPWSHVLGWKSGFLTVGADGLLLWRLHGWGAEFILNISAEPFRAVASCQECVNDWHSMELPAIEMSLDGEPNPIVLFSPAMGLGRMTKFQETLVPCIHRWSLNAGSSTGA